MNGKTLNEMTSRRTGDPVLDESLVAFLALTLRWTTGGAVDLLVESRVDKIKDTPPPDFPAGVRPRCAYLIGAIQGHARVSDQLIPEEMVPFLRDVQEAYQDGQTDRHADQENAGANLVRAAWEATSGT